MSVRLTPYTMKEIDFYEIRRGINCHDKAIIRGEMTEAEVAIFQNYLDSSTVLSLYYSDKELPEGSSNPSMLPKAGKYSKGGSESAMGLDFITFLLMAMQMSAFASMEGEEQFSALETVEVSKKKTTGKTNGKKKAKVENRMSLFDAESSKSFESISQSSVSKSGFEELTFEAMPRKKKMTINKLDAAIQPKSMFGFDSGSIAMQEMTYKTMTSSSKEAIPTLTRTLDSEIRTVAPAVKSHSFKAKSFSSELVKTNSTNMKGIATLAMGMGVVARKASKLELDSRETFLPKTSKRGFLDAGPEMNAFVATDTRRSRAFAIDAGSGSLVQKKDLSKKNKSKKPVKSSFSEINMFETGMNQKEVTKSGMKNSFTSSMASKSVSTARAGKSISGFEDATMVFAGIVSNFKVLSISETWYVEVELKGITSLLDFARVKKDYQSASKTVSQIVDSVFESYDNTRYVLNGKDDAISEFLLQYEESDYHFLQRILSRNKDSIYTNMRGKEGIICLGLSPFSEKEKINPAKYEMEFGKTPAYRIQSQKFYDVGDCITAFGKSLFVKEVLLKYESGEYVNSYLLTVKEGMQRIPMVNEEAVGVSLDGTVMATERDKVQIELQGTPETPESERRWFSYASPASSSDGSGWYCMPKNGEEIRLYCPTEKEAEAYVISAIKSGDSGSGDGGGRNSQDKILSNDAGQAITFTGDGVSMFCADGAAVMLLKPDGTIEIFANNDVNIGSTTDISIKCEQNIAISAAGTFNVINETGSEFVLTEDIAVHANRIRNNG